MRSTPRCRLLRAALSRRSTIEPLERRDLLALTPALLKDINATGDSGIRALGELGGVAYLIADDGIHGSELWRSDGTPGGTTLVKDVWPGASSGLAFAGRGAVLGGYLYFAADDGTTGRELWRTDGTPAGTTLVKDIFAGADHAQPGDFVVLGSTLFFAAFSGQGHELWKTDGTPGGTVLVKDIYPGPNSASPIELTEVNGTLYFNANDGLHGYELWKSNGTAAGTVLVGDLNSFGSDSGDPRDLTNFAGTLVFSGEDGNFGQHVWKVDSGTGNVAVLANLPNGSVGPSDFVQIGSTLFFVANTYTSGAELWKTDGTEPGTVQVADIRPGSNSSYPVLIPNVNGTLFFFANDGTSGTELWKSDGTAPGTVRVKDIRPGSLGSQDSINRGAIGLNGQLLLVANDGASGPELWRSDGTEGGTVLVKETSVGSLGSYPRMLSNLSGTLLYTALDPHGLHLWRTDGTEQGTSLVKLISTSTNGSSGALGFTDLAGKAVFFAGDLEHGGELWTSLGTTATTQLVKDVNPGTGNSYLNGSRAVVGGVMYFSGTDGLGGVELWRTDGTAPGTYLVKDINPLGSSSPTALTAVGNTLYFTANDGTNGPELWKSDGTHAGTVMMQDLRPGSVGSAPGMLANVNGTLYFTANDGATGVEIWKTDGTPGGLALLKDIRPGASVSSQVALLTNVNGTLFFAANQSGSTELWKSDGTGPGTTVVKAWGDGGPGSPASLTNVAGTLFFVANASGSSYELWKSDGTPEGTQLVKDILPGSGTSNPIGLTAVGSQLFFFANDGTSGSELWKSDGTPAGTTLVKDINPGFSGSVLFFVPGMPAPLADVDGVFYFSANDGVHGVELWRSDGTPGGTELVADIAAGASGSNPARLTNIGGDLYFQANDGVTGLEPWIITPLVVDPPPVIGRYIFYNQSKFDGSNAAISAADDAAIATDKVALKFTGSTTAPLSAITSYSRGINGLMIDLAGAAANGLTVADFTFKVGANSNVATWANAPVPNQFSIRAGAGVGGSDRIEITWPNNAIQNTWLQVIVKGNDTLGGFNIHTGLPASDVFFFGNKIGDTFLSSPATIVSTSLADGLGVRNNPGFLQPITSPYDFDRNQTVGISDELIARNNPGILTRNLTWNPPAGPLAVEALVAQIAGQEDGLASFDDRELLDNLAASLAFALVTGSAAHRPGAVDLQPRLAVAELTSTVSQARASAPARHSGAAAAPAAGPRPWRDSQGADGTLRGGALHDGDLRDWAADESCLERFGPGSLLD